MLLKNVKASLGFSLIELLISLIVISCITAAFTPIITKKFSSGVFGGSGLQGPGVFAHHYGHLKRSRHAFL